MQYQTVFEVVKEGWILKKIEHIQTLIGGVFCLVERATAAVRLLPLDLQIELSV
jgi:hypothetical protein